MARPSPVVGIVTCSELPDLFEEERAFPDLLRTHGIDARPVVWSETGVDWEAFDHLVLRSTWDYFTRVEAFRGWLAMLGALRRPQVHNPLSLVHWNLDKRYLEQLSARGVRIVPTRFLRQAEQVRLEDAIRDTGWRQAVLKPTISGGALHTSHFAAEEASRFEPELAAIWRTSDAMLQPFLPEIQTQGEWSLIFFNGQHSHTVLKTPAAGDFRVQGMFGGHFVPVTPPPDMLETAQRIVALLPELPLYVRIDGVMLADGFHLMEAEAIEPYLYTARSEGAADRFARAIAARVRGGPESR